MRKLLLCISILLTALPVFSKCFEFADTRPFMIREIRFGAEAMTLCLEEAEESFLTFYNRKVVVGKFKVTREQVPSERGSAYLYSGISGEVFEGTVSDEEASEIRIVIIDFSPTYSLFTDYRKEYPASAGWPIEMDRAEWFDEFHN